VRLSFAAGAVAFVALALALALAASASAGLWIDLDRSGARPGQVVHGTAVGGCSVCGPAPVYLVNVHSFAGPELLKTLSSNGDPHFVPVGRFTWRQSGRFAFTVPRLRPGVYLLVSFYRFGSVWDVFPASTVLHVRLAGGDPEVSFATFSLNVPNGWHWRRFPGFDGGGGEFSNQTLAGLHGFSPDASPPQGAFILSINPLGAYGSVTAPTIRRSDFMPLSDPARPRGRASADHSYCAPTGRCFSISFRYGSERVPDAVLTAVNHALRSLHATRLPR
jgi:hypothetical protein